MSSAETCQQRCESLPPSALTREGREGLAKDARSEEGREEQAFSELLALESASEDRPTFVAGGGQRSAGGERGVLAHCTRASRSTYWRSGRRVQGSSYLALPPGRSKRG